MCAATAVRPSRGSGENRLHAWKGARVGSAVKGGARGVRTNGSKLVSPSTRSQASPLDRAKADEVAWKEVSDLFNVARGVRLRGDKALRFVYVMSEDDEGPVKIGVAADPVGRLRTMRTGNPRRLRLEFVLLGDHTVEGLLHELWAPFRFTGEWFRGECRPALFPILRDAVSAQVAYLSEPRTVSFDKLRDITRAAHGENPLVRAKDPEPERMLDCGNRWSEASGNCCELHMVIAANRERKAKQLEHLATAKDALARVKANGSHLNVEPLERRLATTEKKLLRRK